MSFDEVDIQSVLALRPHHPPDYEDENRTLATLKLPGLPGILKAFCSYGTTPWDGQPLRRHHRHECDAANQQSAAKGLCQSPLDPASRFKGLIVEHNVQ